MKISPIFVYSLELPKFKGYDDSHNYDFGTEYNNFSIKDTIIYSLSVSTFLFLCGLLLNNEDKIKTAIRNGKNKLNMLV